MINSFISGFEGHGYACKKYSERVNFKGEKMITGLHKVIKS